MFVYIHRQGIAHRDIKAENILVRGRGEEYDIKIIDWGLGAVSGDGVFVRKCGTP